MKVQVLQHVAFEGLGSIADWLAARKADAGYTRFFRNELLPDPSLLDLVIVMGGPMSVNDEQEHPWLVEEKRFIREAISRGVSILGICLGAQMIASALGGRVYPNRVKEIGWFPVHSVGVPKDCLHLPTACEVFHWHGETFDLPEGAVLLANSAACANQAFQWKRNVIGLQFHLETTASDVTALVENCGDELTPGAFIQSGADMRAVSPDRYREVHAVMARVLSYLAGRRATPAI